MNNEQPSTHYLFIRHSCSDKNCLMCRRQSIFLRGEYFFWVLSKNCITGETATNCLRRKIDSLKRRITVYTLFVFRLLFVVSSVFHRYLQISVGKCTALAINVGLFGWWYGPTAQCEAVRKIYGLLVPLYGCTVKNTAFCFSALKTDFLKLSWLEVWILFCYSQFWAEGAILVVKYWSYTGRW